MNELANVVVVFSRFSQSAISFVSTINVRMTRNGARMNSTSTNLEISFAFYISGRERRSTTKPEILLSKMAEQRPRTSYIAQ
jgi:hypothetical protein